MLRDGGPRGRGAALTTELFLAFHEGRHELDDEALHERAKFALGITTASPMLALLSWAFAENGDEEMAELLRDEAQDRHPGKLMSVPMPKLDAWLNKEHARAEGPKARAAPDEDLDEREAQVDAAGETSVR